MNELVKMMLYEEVWSLFDRKLTCEDLSINCGCSGSIICSCMKKTNKQTSFQPYACRYTFANQWQLTLLLAVNSL